MYKGVDFDRDLAEAQAALKKAEETYGPDHVNVSYRLDEMAKLLRSNGGRTLDAVNIEARAKVIRIKANKTDMQKLTSQHHEISDAVRTAGQKQQAEKTRQAFTTVAIVCVCLVIAGRLLLAPSPSERQAAQSFLKNVKTMLPTTIVQNMVDKGQASAKDVEVANKKHNDQIEQYMGSDTEGK